MQVGRGNGGVVWVHQRRGKLDDGEEVTGLSSTFILSHVENNSSCMLAVANMVLVSGAR